MNDGELRPSEGWGVIHLFLRTERGEDGSGILQAIARFTETDPNQAIVFSVLGGRADLGLMLLSPTWTQLDRVVKEITGGPVECLDSFVSLTEHSEYTTTEDEERARLESTGEADVEGTLTIWRDRMAHYKDARLHPRLPAKRFICFYPMSKSRIPGANWFELPFDERKVLMRGHATTGRTLLGPRPAAHHGCHRIGRLGVGGDAPGRRPCRRQGDRLRDALRRRQRQVRPVRPILGGPGHGTGRGTLTGRASGRRLSCRPKASLSAIRRACAPVGSRSR